MPADRAYHTVPSLARSLGVDQAKILHWLHTGQLAGINIAENPHGRPRWRIPSAAWEQFQQARSNQASIPVTRAPRRRRRETAGIIQFY